jgi:phosphoesterase RecJ-like protein
MHKKVSFVSSEKIERRYAFLPWYDKLREHLPSGADCIVSLEKTSLYEVFLQENIKINKKMATSLYAASLVDSCKLQGAKVDGTFFAQMSELITLGADYKVCRKYLIKSESLSLFRLKSLMFGKMMLKDDARTALFILNEDDMKSSGASLNEAIEISKEALSIVHVQKVLLYDETNNLIYMQEEI